MNADHSFNSLLSEFDADVYNKALKVREIIIENLPGIIEQSDIPARMIAYCYGQKYSELICVIIPSKKGLKFGFNQGVNLPDPENLLKGNGKISRFTEITSIELINSIAFKNLIINALELYNQRMGKNE